MEGGGGESKFPIGIRFRPRDDELVEFYLLPKLQGRPTVPNESVIEANVYEHHPDTLTNLHRSEGQEEWYFLSSRQRMYGNGVRPARKTRDGRGRWKASTATKEVAEEVVCNGRVKFCKSVLNYFEGNPKKETRTKWIMLELTVPEYEIKLDNPGAKNMLDEYVMCKIYVSPQHKKKGDDDDDDEGTSSAFEEEEEEACSSSTPHGQGGAPESSMLAEKQTGGKRPMVELEQPPQGGSFFAPAQKQARHQGSMSIGSTTQASYSAASNNAASSMQAYYGGPGQLTGAHRDLQFQAPPQTQRPAGACNGRTAAKPPVAGAGGGRGLVQLPATTPVRYQPFADPKDGHPFGQMAATMTRPPTTGSASQAARLQSIPGSQAPRHPGTAFRPHVSLQCCYDQNYRPAQVQQPPPGHASSSSQLQRLPAAFQPRQQMQQPFLNGGADRRGGVAAVPRGQYYNGYPYQRSSSVAPAEGGAVKERNGAARFNVNAEQFFVDLATINPSLAGGFTQPSPAPAPSRPIESPSPAAAGVAEVKTETGETSGLNTQDAA